ncbi:CPBP family glutamic-type intramembrane protease [Methylomonas rivi]|uniref:CPBP family glutamic-type intramembrane protease n=1 Tax=Methylomonas rivi TaxID=2952226 RepID=A0ABT1U2K3_9GAMM|nr:CPBP family glutamic-type intramembrane protease [Methylomonas sp. WSC-6]
MGRFLLMGRLTMMFAPLAIIVGLSAVASLLGFGLLRLAGDVLPLHKVISKLTLILLLLSIFPLRNMLRLSWAELGFTPAPRFFKQMGQGLLFAVLTLAPVLLLLYALDVHVWDSSRVWTPGKVLEKTALSLFLALLIGVGEEMLFRGLLLSALRRRLPLLAAMGVSAFYYAALHFLKSKTQIPHAEQTLGSGFRLMAEAFVNWLDPRYLTALLALFVVGVFLAVLRTRVPQSLALCIGCHAGWVWQIKISKDLCNVNLQSDYLYLVNTAYDGVVGPLVGVWLTIAVWAWLKIGQLPKPEN